MSCALIPETAEVGIHVTIKRDGVVRLQDESFVPGAGEIVYKTLPLLPWSDSAWVWLRTERTDGQRMQCPVL